jgi:hypothetical protein
MPQGEGGFCGQPRKEREVDQQQKNIPKAEHYWKLFFKNSSRYFPILVFPYMVFAVTES